MIKVKYNNKKALLIRFRKGQFRLGIIISNLEINTSISYIFKLIK